MNVKISALITTMLLVFVSACTTHTVPTELPTTTAVPLLATETAMPPPTATPPTRAVRSAAATPTASDTPVVHSVEEPALEIVFATPERVFEAFPLDSGSDAEASPTSEATESVISLTNGPFTLVSVSSTGEQGNRGSENPSISADGRYVVFKSTANNLVPNGPGGGNIFIHDRETRETQMVTDNGEYLDGSQQNPVISANGCCIAFSQPHISTTQIEQAGTGHKDDVYVYDRSTGELFLVSIPHAQNGEVQGFSQCPSISADGRLIAFKSDAVNLTESYDAATLSPRGITRDQVYLHDRETGTTRLISHAPNGVPGDGHSNCPVISGDGQKILFASTADNLVSASWHSLRLYMHDVSTGETTLLRDDIPVTFLVYALSHNGQRYMTTLNTRPYETVVAVDLATGREWPIGFTGTSEEADIRNPHLSADGRYVVFSTNPRQLEAGWILYRYDLETSTMEQLYVSQERDAAFIVAVPSADGQTIALVSIERLVEETTGRDYADIFVYQHP